MLLHENIDADPEIFGEASGLVRSEALVRLRISLRTPAGLLAFGSRDPERFGPSQATELLNFLARVLEHCIRTWLRLPE